MQTQIISRAQRRRGFTLVEVLIVVVILGILAATVLPQFTMANDDAKEAALIQDLQVFRSQIELYRFQHGGIYPGQNVDKSAGDARKFKDSLLLSSDGDTTVGDIGTKPYGPYFIGSLPPNPFNSGRGVLITTDVPNAVPDESLTDADGELVGWIYNPVTGQIKGNNQGTARDGRPLDEL